MENTKNSSEVVVLTSYPTAAEAEVAASMLRSMGIEVELTGEIASIMLPYINDNQVNLLVSAADRQRALDLLAAEPEK